MNNNIVSHVFDNNVKQVNMNDDSRTNREISRHSVHK